MRKAAADLELAQVRVAKARLAADAATEKHGGDSLQAREAIAKLRQAELAAESATEKHAAAQTGTSTHTVDSDDSDQPELYYGSVAEFVEDFVIPTFRRNIGEDGRANLRWSARWWESAEAILRLEAMWRAWEHLRLDPATGMSVWLRDHADPHMAVLMSPSGPWAKSTDTARPEEPLPHIAPPPDLFPDVRE